MVTSPNLINIGHTYDAQLIDLEEEALWGTHGARYRVHDVAHDIALLPRPAYFTLSEGGRLVGAFIQVPKRVSMAGSLYDARYQCLLAVHASEGGKGIGKRLVVEAQRQALAELGDRGLAYAYVEDQNERSLRIFRGLGYRRLGGFCVQAFSRVRPMDDRRVAVATEAQRAEVIDLLERQFADHLLGEHAQSVPATDYYVLTENGHILAGVQAVPQRWTLAELPGLSGALLLRVLPRLPLLRQLLNPADFRMVRASNHYVRTGHEPELFTLLEAVLARRRLHNAIIPWDHRSPVFQRVAAHARYGLIGSMTATPASVLACFKGFADSEVDELCRRPLCISPIDP